MIAVDTNVLVRVLIDDPTHPEQVRLARQFAKKAHHLFIPQVVQIELIWVLETAYKFAKPDILLVLNHLQENETFNLQHEEQFHTALQLFQTTTADFADCMILAQSSQEKYKVVTFDKKFAKLLGASLIE